MATRSDYMSGFGNEFESEDEDYRGALPLGLINPQRCKYNLFAEQLSGSAFTAPRATNKRTWFYRLRPSVCHEPYKRMLGRDGKTPVDLGFKSGQVDPNQRRWSPFNKLEDEKVATDFVDGLRLLAYSDADSSSSVAIYMYLANKSMSCRSIFNSDGDFLIVPQKGEILVTTEFGNLGVEPNEIVVIQQGMKFTIHSYEQPGELIRGYVLEVKGNHFELPYLGPIGANGLANPRDFQVPRAYVDKTSLEDTYEVVCKFQNELFTTSQKSPYDVAAWFGNYVPYKYNLEKFVSVNSVSVDHPDPSIFTVLTCPSIGKPGTALADFVIFPPRWECAQNTFRPPYYHRNCMTEFMGLIKGQYQAKSGKFAPGGASLHQAMIPHGPDKECFEMASQQDTSVPKRMADDTMAFMFETSLTLKLTEWALKNNVDDDYHKCWQGLANLKVLTSDSS